MAWHFKVEKKVSLALGLVSMCVIYNLICIILFSIFPFFFSFMKSSWWLVDLARPTRNILTVITRLAWATGTREATHPKCSLSLSRLACKATLLTDNLATSQGESLLLCQQWQQRQIFLHNKEFDWGEGRRRKGKNTQTVLSLSSFFFLRRMGMQLPGGWQSVPGQPGAGAGGMSGQHMAAAAAAAAAVTQQGGMVASYPMQQFQV